MEKGGKGFSLPPQTARKSSLKSNPQGVASLKGKDDSSTKSKRGKKVQFNFEGSPEAIFSPQNLVGRMKLHFQKAILTNGEKVTRLLPVEKVQFLRNHNHWSSKLSRNSQRMPNA